MEKEGNVERLEHRGCGKSCGEVYFLLERERERKRKKEKPW